MICTEKVAELKYNMPAKEAWHIAKQNLFANLEKKLRFEAVREVTSSSLQHNFFGIIFFARN